MWGRHKNFKDTMYGTLDMSKTKIHILQPRLYYQLLIFFIFLVPPSEGGGVKILGVFFTKNCLTPK